MEQLETELLECLRDIPRREERGIEQAHAVLSVDKDIQADRAFGVGAPHAVREGDLLAGRPHGIIAGPPARRCSILTGRGGGVTGGGDHLERQIDDRLTVHR